MNPTRRVNVLELIGELLADYATKAKINAQAMMVKVRAGLVYWSDLDFRTLAAKPDEAEARSIDKTGLMQAYLEKLSRLCMHDALTGLFNRRYFDIALVREGERSYRDQRPLSLALLDIDHFKRINDAWGHDGGDAVLQTFAGILQSSVRQSDVAARVGGEEFAVVMPGSRHHEAVRAMERLREKIESSPVSLPGGSCDFKTSIGVAVLEPAQFRSTDDLYKQADQALYKAKSSGRNRVVLFEGPPDTGLSPAEREALWG